MKVYYVDDRWNEPTLEERNVERTTECFVFLDKEGPRYSKRCEKSWLGSRLYESALDAVSAYVAKHEASVQHAREMVASRSEALRGAVEWARQKTVELQAASPNK